MMCPRLCCALWTHLTPTALAAGRMQRVAGRSWQPAACCWGIAMPPARLLNRLAICQRRAAGGGVLPCNRGETRECSGRCSPTQNPIVLSVGHECCLGSDGRAWGAACGDRMHVPSRSAEISSERLSLCHGCRRHPTCDESQYEGGDGRWEPAENACRLL